ncbi:response regulator [bacterium]|nr:response regulator [bacterium]
MNFILLLLFILFLPIHLFSQSYSPLPFIRNYSANEYKASPYNFCITQSLDGRMYFANTHGVLEYDGAHWQVFPNANVSPIHSLAWDSSGRLLAGGESEFGYYSSESGSLHYTSLTALVDSVDRDFLEVWDVVVIGHDAYFQASGKILKWSGQTIKTIPALSRLFNIFQIHGQLWSSQAGRGLVRLDGDSLKLLPGGEAFANLRISNGLAIDSDRVLLTTREGIFVYQNGQVTRFKTSNDDLMRRANTYRLTLLTGGQIAVMTIREGVIIMNSSGVITDIYNSASGLSNQTTVFGYEDRQRGLWVCNQSGLTRIETGSPFKMYSTASGFKHYTYTIAGGGNDLYVSTEAPVYILRNGAMTQFPAIKTRAIGIISRGSSTLIATADGIYEISNGSERLIFNESTKTLYNSPTDPNVLYATLSEGNLVRLTKTGSTWQSERIAEFVADARLSMLEDGEYLWIGTSGNGYFRIHIPSRRLEHFTEKNGLLRSGNNQVTAFEGRPAFATDLGLLRFDSTAQMFYEDSVYAQLGFRDSSQVFRAEEIGDKLWMFVSDTLGYAQKDNNGRWRWYPNLFYRIQSMGAVFNFYSDRDSIMWITSEGGLIRIDLKRINLSVPSYSTLISGIVIDNERYNFHEHSSNLIPYGFGNMRFLFTAPVYDDESQNRFQFYMEGFDDTWSDWMYENQKDYTRLSEGQYTFHVRSKNIYDNIGNEAVVAFQVLPPWYRTAWMYSVYILIIGGFVYAAAQWRSRQLLEDKRRLEKIIDERTEKIREQAQRLEELDQTKSRFFANISHEFRTPLTLIIGPLEDFLNQTDEHSGAYRVMLKHARRLLRLINQILDIAKLENRSMRLTVAPVDIHFVKAIVQSFASLADRKNLTLEFTEKINGSIYPVDQDKFEKIIYNLVSNAIKFTPAGGRVEIALSEWPPDREFPSGSLGFEVSDTGIGIPSDRVDKIFDRFYQVDATISRDQEGTGIGLALTKELVELHHGKISVQNKQSIGTRFIVQLPKNLSDYQPNEITETPTSGTQPGELEHSVLETSANRIETVPSANSELILIVEDNPDVQHYIGEHLSSYRILYAKDGNEGLEIAGREIPDLIVSDVMMPRKDGYAFLRDLRADQRTNHIPVILLTARADRDHKLEGLEIGADEYMVKPFDSKELSVRVRNLIELRRQLREKFSKNFFDPVGSKDIQSADERFIQKICEAIDHEMTNPDFGVEDLGKIIGLSRFQLSRKLTAITGQSPTEFIRSMRLKRAYHLLKNKTGNVTEVAYDVGFNNLSYFAKCFKDQFGTNPSDI